MILSDPGKTWILLKEMIKAHPIHSQSFKALYPSRLPVAYLHATTKTRDMDTTSEKNAWRGSAIYRPQLITIKIWQLLRMSFFMK